MTFLFYIAIFIFLYLFFRPFQSSLEKRVRKEEILLKNYGFRRIEGGYYILKDGKTGIYTREEAVKKIQTGIDPRTTRTCGNNEHID